MGNKAHRMGDANTGGGTITTIPQSTVFANSKVLAVNGSKGTGHGVGIHAVNAWDTANGSSTVNAGGSIYAYHTKYFTVEWCKFENSSAANGGAIFSFIIKILLSVFLNKKLLESNV